MCQHSHEKRLHPSLVFQRRKCTGMRTQKGRTGLLKEGKGVGVIQCCKSERSAMSDSYLVCLREGNHSFSFAY